MYNDNLQRVIAYLQLNILLLLLLLFYYKHETAKVDFFVVWDISCYLYSLQVSTTRANL